MVFSFNQIKNMPFHYVVFDISCPNTHEGRVDNADELDHTLATVRPLNQLNLPIFVKLSPDSPLEFLQTIAALGITHGVKGYVCGNTSQMRSNLKTPAQTIEAIGRGGLSGAPLKTLAIKLCARMYELKGPGQEIIGSGGVMNGQDAYDFIKAGASAVQIYTALVYEGPFAANVINRELADLLKKDQTTVEEAVGMSAHLLSASAQHI
jgi:dihydroorotate dehydrogenase